MKRLSPLLLGWALLSLLPMKVAAEAPPRVELGAPSARTLVLETRHPLTVRAYQPPYELQPAQSRAAASAASPEKALEGWLGAILKRDRAWLLESFEEASRARLAAIDPKTEDRFFAWLFDGRRVVLQNRIEIAQRLLIEVAIFDRQSGEQLFLQRIGLRQEGDRWLLADLPKERIFTELATHFDASNPKLVVDLGHAIRTGKP